jgi:uncharacterized DUF497 family protein
MHTLAAKDAVKDGAPRLVIGVRGPPSFLLWDPYISFDTYARICIYTIVWTVRVRFEWDDEKNATNLKKHRIDFETASLVFDDPNQLTTQDREVDGEERWQTVGLADGVHLLLVAHTIADEEDGEEVVRIISARKAVAHERRNYEEGL